MHPRFLSALILVPALAATACGGTTQSGQQHSMDGQSGEAGSRSLGVGGGDTDGLGGMQVGVGGSQSSGGAGVGGSYVLGGGTGGGTGGSVVTGGGTGGGTGGSLVTGGGTGGGLVTGGGTGGGVGTGGSGNVSGGGTGGADGIGGASGAPGTGGVVNVPVCQMEPDPGGCTADLPRYYFEPSTVRCEEFSYSGCDGNDNRFETAGACRDACGGLPPALCELPQDVGPCDAAVPRYWFNEGTGQCELFSYGGCEGNANNFTSEAECLRACGGGPQPGCPLAQPAGACSATGIQCHYDYFNSCLCTTNDPYICNPIPTCTGSGGTGGAGGSSGTGGVGAASGAGAAAGAPQAVPSEGGASAAELPVPPCVGDECSSDAAVLPPAMLCACDATGTWVCDLSWV